MSKIEGDQADLKKIKKPWLMGLLNSDDFVLFSFLFYPELNQNAVIVARLDEL
jgi:hypothetical protein